jgi:replication-associated recombination protein RarA
VEITQMEAAAEAKRAAHQAEAETIIHDLKQRHEMSSRDLSRLELKTDRELQALVNRREEVRQTASEAKGKVAAAASVNNRDVEACESLRRALQNTIRDGDADTVHTLLHGAAKGAMRALIVSISRDTSVAEEVCHELYVHTDIAATEDDTVMQTCRRGLSLMSSGELLKASCAFRAIATGDDNDVTEYDRNVARLLDVLCAAKLNVHNGREDPLPTGGGRVGASLRQLLRSLSPSAGERLSLVRSVAFLASPTASRMKPCAMIAMACVLQGAAALSPIILQPHTSRAQESDAERVKLQRQADEERERVPALHDILQLTGLRPIKKRFFQVRDRIRLSVVRKEDVSKENHNTIFIGNPGTGKTTVARLYAQLLHQSGALAKDTFEETSGAKLLAGGLAKLQDHLANLDDGGVLFIDEVYQLKPNSNQLGGNILDYLLTEMEDRRGKLVVVIAGYAKPQEELLAHNEGLPSRFPHPFTFPDFTDEELCSVLLGIVESHTPRFNLLDEKCARIAARRLGAQRDTPGFGNARAVRNFWEQTLSRQSNRILASDCGGPGPEYFALWREDLLGPRDVRAASEAALKELDGMIGLDAVKSSVHRLMGLIETNTEREDAEEPLQSTGLNRVLLGNPGTGKTTVAKIYGRILRDIGLLSKGDVLVKNPSDFIGGALGQSEANTNAILDAARGCVLVIDEAYGLHAGSNMADPYKTSVIDTLVARVQGVPGEDMCVLLLGYDTEMRKMLRESNPGLSRRFQLEEAFVFVDYTDDQLFTMLLNKAQASGWRVRMDAGRTAVQVLAKQRMQPNFGNGGAVANLLSTAVQRVEKRLQSLPAAQRAACKELTAVDFTPNGSPAAHATPDHADLESVFADLVGCTAVLDQIHDIHDTVTFAMKQGRDPLDDLELSFVFAGDPGTGKTTVARRMGELFHRFGLLGSAEVVEVSASEFSTGYVGQSAGKAREIFQRTRGKVLFVDEAYRLNPARGGPFMREAIGEIVQMLTEPDFHNKLLLIFAGYDEDMDALLAVNAGLKSRVPGRLSFMPFDVAACVAILKKQLAAKDIKLSPDADEIALSAMASRLISAPGWSNGRDIDTWARAVVRQVAKDPEGKKTATASVKLLEAALKPLLADKEKGQKIHAKQLQMVPATEPMDMDAQFAHADPPATAPSLTVQITTPKIKMAMHEEEVEEWETLQLEGRERAEGDGDEVFAALQLALVELGYDKDHQTRTLLVSFLSAVEAGSPFPDDIMRQVRRQLPSTPPARVEDALRPQLRGVIASFSAAVEYEELRLSELRRLEEEQRQGEAERLREEERQMQAKLKRMGCCPAGFAWHREGCGWRCNGGAHYVGQV